MNQEDAIKAVAAFKSVWSNNVSINLSSLLEIVAGMDEENFVQFIELLKYAHSAPQKDYSAVYRAALPVVG